jgi:hypothetical protein
VDECELRATLDELAARALPPDAADAGWPALRERLAASRRSRRRRPAPRARLALALVAILVALGLLGTAQAAPQALQALRVRFGLALVPTMTITPGHGIEREGPPPLTLAQAQARVSFTIRQPAWLPKGVVFKAAVAFPPRLGELASDGVVLFYAGAHGTGGLSLQEIRPDPSGSAGPAVPAERVLATRVNGQPAAYAHGGWQPSGQGQATWDDRLDTSFLSWDAGGLDYLLTAIHLGLGEADLLRNAASMR